MIAREALVAAYDAYLRALAEGRPESLRLDEGARFTECGQAMPLGSGLWGTVEQVGSCYARFADVRLGQVAGYCAVREGGDLAVLMVRLALSGAGTITEIETVVCRRRGVLFRPEAMFAPSPILRKPDCPPDREFLARVPHLYFDAIIADDAAKLPIRDDCVRIECGEAVTCQPEDGARKAARGFDLYSMGVAEQIDCQFFCYCTAIEERRVYVDEEQGIAFAMARFDFPGTVRSWRFRRGEERPTEPHQRVPRSILIMEAFQVDHGRITAIETIFENCPFLMPTGW